MYCTMAKHQSYCDLLTAAQSVIYLWCGRKPNEGEWYYLLLESLVED